MQQQEEKIVETALMQLEITSGIKGHWRNLQTDIDGEITLSIGGNLLHASAVVKKELRQYQLVQLLEKAKLYKPFMVVAEHIFPSIKENLRKEKIAYLDGAGNIFIRDRERYLWIDGQKAGKRSKPVTNRAFTRAGLRVVFFLLHEPAAINMPYRQLAQRTGVALGNIQNVLEGLKDAGFILQKNKSQMVMHNKPALLRRWIDGYGETLKPSLHLGNYRFWDKHTINNGQTPEVPEHVAALWGGEGAAAEMTGYLNAKELTLYTDNKMALVNKWTLIPDAEGMLHLYEKFWDLDSVHNNGFAPPLLVYADLVLTNDPRCIEAAEMIHHKYLQDEFEGN